MRWLALLAMTVSLVGCNPAVRCKASSECGGGVCTGGFCADLSTAPVVQDAGEDAGVDAGEPPSHEDQDDPDAGSITDAGATDFDAGNNGRGP